MNESISGVLRQADEAIRRAIAVEVEMKLQALRDDESTLSRRLDDPRLVALSMSHFEAGTTLRLCCSRCSRSISLVRLVQHDSPQLQRSWGDRLKLFPTVCPVDPADLARRFEWVPPPTHGAMAGQVDDRVRLRCRTIRRGQPCIGRTAGVPLTQRRLLTLFLGAVERGAAHVDVPLY